MTITNNDDLPVPDLLTSLKAKADLMGIKYHPSIGVEALREKVNAKLNDTPASGEASAPKDQDPGVPGSDVEVTYGAETESQRKVRLQREASELVRIRLTCMNPLKKEWPGEIISVGNDVVGTYKKLIPFGLEEGYHVPRIILEQLQEKVFQTFYWVPGPRGEKIRRGKLAKEYAIEILPALTAAEIKDLAQRQAMSGSIDNG